MSCLLIKVKKSAYYFFSQIYIFISIISLFIGGSSMASIFSPKIHTLKNGLQILVIENHLAPVVSIGVLYKVGTADDPSDQVGLSHFLEHMMFKGTKSVPGNQFKKMITSKGGSTNAVTSFDYTCYETTIASSWLEMMLKLEADRMENLSFTKEEIESERKVVLEERNMRLENNQFGAMIEAIQKATYWYHPYSIPPIGYPHHINNYGYESVHKHYNAYYAPNNAILILSGAVNFEEVKNLTEKYFGSIPKKDIPKRERPQEPDHQDITIHLKQTNKRNSLTILQWLYQAPNHKGKNKEYYYPLILLNQILGGNETTRFYRTFIEEKKLALSIGTYYDAESFDPKTFSFSVVLNPGVTEETFKKELKDYLNALIANGVSEGEFTQAKKHLLAEILFSRDGTENPIDFFKGLAVGLSVEELEQWGAKIEKVTLEELNSATQWLLKKNPIVMVSLYPK